MRGSVAENPPPEAVSVCVDPDAVTASLWVSNEDGLVPMEKRQSFQIRAIDRSQVLGAQGSRGAQEGRGHRGVGERRGWG